MLKITTALTQRLNSLLASTLELRQLSGKVRQLRAYQVHYEQIAPPSLLRSSHVMLVENNLMTLAANNGAIAAKLRQLAPELARQLQLRGCEVTGIQVMVQVDVPPVVRPEKPATISPAGKLQLSELAETLDDSPLKSALQRLAGNIKRKQ